MQNWSAFLKVNTSINFINLAEPPYLKKNPPQISLIFKALWEKQNLAAGAAMAVQSWCEEGTQKISAGDNSHLADSLEQKRNWDWAKQRENPNQAWWWPVKDFEISENHIVLMSRQILAV